VLVSAEQGAGAFLIGKVGSAGNETVLSLDKPLTMKIGSFTIKNVYFYFL
jgi:hypothetical protein